MDSDTIAAGEAYLAHYGIPGMKWGRRRSESALRAERRATRQEASPAHADHKMARDLSKKRIKNLSNDELRKLNERLNLEQQYARLNPSSGARRQAKVEKTLKQLKLAKQAWDILPDAQKQSIVTKGAKVVAKIKA